jgi:prepilin-type N-terminal cleavage/methylation domain-containing protein
VSSRGRALARQAGLTLLEVMLAISILAVMMVLAWRTMATSMSSRDNVERFEFRNHELRMAMARMVADFEASYLSRNEDTNAPHPRTMFIAKSNSKLPEVRFSTFGHRVLWADANESEQTVISYVSRSSPDRPGATDLVRREQRRLSNELPDDVPAEYDVLIHDIGTLKLEFWNWKSTEWQDTWDTTQADGQKGWLPSRVRITVTVPDRDGKDYKLVTQARIPMQEPLNFVQ